MSKFSVCIRDNGRITRSWIVEKDWDDIDAYALKVESAFAPMRVDIMEFEGDCGVDDSEYHECMEN